MKTYPLCFIFLLLCFSDKIYCQNIKDGTAAINADSLRKHISVLASDDFQGRLPFTKGETKTINYLREQFKIAGLEAGNGKSYFQNVPMVSILAIAAPTMHVQSPKGNFDLKAHDDYIIWTDKTDEHISIDNTPLVFAGYGVVAPEYNWNDYAGLDVRGKVVMVMVNDPGYASGDPSFFKGTTMTYYGRWSYKFEEAARQGAKGCLIVHNTAAASYPFAVPQNNFNTSKLQLDKRGKHEKNCDIIGWVTEQAAQELLSKAGLDSGLLKKAHLRSFKAVDMHTTLSTTMHVQSTYKMSHNVIGKITGTKHSDEIIIYTAHWDHLGIGKPDEKGDSIYNGALDNASGTAGLLELARAFKSLKTPPQRTIIFLSVTGEEQGLQGSSYYANNPVYPIRKTVGNINMDVLNNFDKTHDMIVVGQGQNDLEDILKEEAIKVGRYIGPESHPEAGHYFRSDHFSFAKVGVPALDASGGIDVEGKGKEYGQKLKDDYTAKHYHRPSDEFDPNTWTMAGAVEDLKLYFLVGKRLAFSDKWPKWKATSEFKKLRR